MATGKQAAEGRAPSGSPRTMRGRKAVDTETTPGKILALALVALAPEAFAFILMPLATGGQTDRTLVQVVLYGTPIVAIASLVLFARAPSVRREHRASRMGALLSGIALLLWVLVLIPALRGRL
jgi:hypothetical protein